jgi:hypothetical protein
MAQPELAKDRPLKLSEDQVDDLADRVNGWLAAIDHADAKGNVNLHPESVEALKTRLQPILKKIQYFRREDFSWPHY